MLVIGCYLALGSLLLDCFIVYAYPTYALSNSNNAY